MNLRRLPLLAALAASCAAPALAGAQTIRQLTRATATTGSNDSLVFAISDSAARTRGLSGTELKATLSRGAAFDSLFATKLRLGSAVSNSATWSSTQAFAAGQRVDSATGSARSQTLTTSRTFWGLSFDGSANVTGKPAFASAWSSTGRDSLLAGSALAFAANDTVYGQPVWNALQHLTADSATGAQRSQTLTTTRALWGQNFDGSAAITGSLTSVGNITGGASSMTVLAGTGASRTLTLQSSNSASAALNTVVLGADTTTTFLGRSVHSDGTAAAPAVNFTNSTGTGLYRFGADTLGIASAGAAQFLVSAGRLTSAGNMVLNVGNSGTSTTLLINTRNSGGTATPALRINELQQIKITNGTAANPALTFTSDTVAGLYRFGLDTLGLSTAGAHTLRISGGAAAVLAGGAGNMTVIAGTGASRTMTLQSTNASSVALNTLVLGADTSITAIGRYLAPSATVSLPAYSFSGATADGIYRPAGDTITFSLNGVRGLSIAGGATASLVGGAGNMTVLGGTGASRTMTLQTTNSSSVGVNTLVLGADSSVTVLGRLVPASVKGITGTTTNDNAQAGAVGEIISGSRATGSSLSLATATPLTVDSISLTAGDWDVSGVVAFTPAATTSITYLAGGISTTTNVLGALGNNFEWATAANVPTAAHDPVWVTPEARISLSGTAFVYLVQSSVFSASTLKGYGAIHARRIR